MAVKEHFVKALQLNTFGRPTSDTVSLVEVATPQPGDGQVVVDLIAAPVNPSDLLLIAGRYGYRPPLPSLLGAEGVGRVVAVGGGVDASRVGEQVLVVPTLQNTTWREQAVVASAEAIAVDGDPHQLAMLGINPMTAWAMLFGIVDLPAGATILQTGAGSATTSYVRTLARRAGFRVIDIVNRPETVASLQAGGAASVFVDGPDVVSQVTEELAGGHIDLILDAVGGPTTTALASLMVTGGSIVSYTSRRGEPVLVPVPDLIFRGLTVHGFWLMHWLKATPSEEVSARYRELADLIEKGVLRADVAATYPISSYQEALAHAASNDRTGKVLFTFGNDAG